MKVSQIKKDIQSKTVAGLNGAGEDIQDLFKEVLQRDFYDAYNPKLYDRKNIIPNEVQKSSAVSNGSGASVEVYYDAGAGGHPRPTAKDIFGYEHHVDYSEEEILTAVMSGYHMVGISGRGAKTANTWFNTLAEFDAKKDEIIPRNLRAAGLPVH